VRPLHCGDIAMLPVSPYNRTVLSADGAALSYTLVVTALCFGSAQNLRAPLQSI